MPSPLAATDANATCGPHQIHHFSSMGLRKRRCRHMPKGKFCCVGLLALGFLRLTRRVISILTLAGGVLYFIGMEQGMECCWSYPPRYRVGVHASIKFHSKVTTEIHTSIRLVQLSLFVRRDTLMWRCHSSPLQYHLWLSGVLHVICADCGLCRGHILRDFGVKL